MLPGYEPPHDVLVGHPPTLVYTVRAEPDATAYPSEMFMYFEKMNQVDHEPRAVDEFIKETALRISSFRHASGHGGLCPRFSH